MRSVFKLHDKNGVKEPDEEKWNEWNILCFVGILNLFFIIGIVSGNKFKKNVTHHSFFLAIGISSAF